MDTLFKIFVFFCVFVLTYTALSWFNKDEDKHQYIYCCGDVVEKFPVLEKHHRKAGKITHYYNAEIYKVIIQDRKNNIKIPITVTELEYVNIKIGDIMCDVVSQKEIKQIK